MISSKTYCKHSAEGEFLFTMDEDERTYWENIYRQKAPDAVSWYRRHLETSLSLIERSAPDRNAPIIDIGGGESTLVDDLLASGSGKSPLGGRRHRPNGARTEGV